MRNVKPELSYILILLVSCFVLVSHLALNFFNNISPYLWLFPIAINVFVVIYYRNQVPIAIMLSFFIPYFYVPKYFFVDNLFISYWPAFQTSLDINFISLLNCLFILSVLFGIGSVNRLTSIKFKFVGIIEDKLIFYIVLFSLALIIVFAISGENIFVSGRYGTGEVSKSPLYEYAIILFLLLVLMIDVHSKVQVTLLVVTFFTYNIKSLIFGGRIEVLQLCLLYSYFFFDFFNNQKIKVVVGCLLAFIFMNVVGQIRSNPFLLYSLNDLIFFPDFDVERTNISTQFGDVYQSSLRVIGLLQEGVINTFESTVSFLSVILGSVFPSTVLPEVYNLSVYRRDLYMSGGGGLISAYSFIWLSYLGPIVFGLFIGRSIRGFYLSQSLVVRVYGLLVLVTFPRWFAYYPVALFKMSLIGALLVLCYLQIKKYYSNRSKLSENSN